MKKVTPRVLSGFPEYLPAQQIAFNRMLETIRTVYERYGFTPIETPAIELAEILLAKGGGETEQEIYRFTKGENDLALHYDLTVPLARYVAQHENDLVMPFRRYQMQKNWRAERPQKGRFREFMQCDIDIIGSSSVLHDAEVVAVVNEVFSRLNIGKFVVRLSNRKLLIGFIESIGLGGKTDDIMHLVDKFEKIGEEAVVEGLKKVGLGSSDAEQVVDFVNITGTTNEMIEQLKGLSIAHPVFMSGLDEVEQIASALKALKVDEKNYRFDLRIVRGLDYYTGTVYETNLIDYPEFGSVCSGGRYDDLAGYYTKSSLPGVGISIGLTRLFSAMVEAGLVENTHSTPTKVLVANFGGKSLDRSLTVASALREANISTQVYFEDAKIDKQFKYADRLGIEYVIVIGEEEVKSGEVVLKNMKTSNQQTVSLDVATKQLST